MKAEKKRKQKERVVVDQERFDAALKKLLGHTPSPRRNIRTSGKRGSKKPILAK